LDLTAINRLCDSKAELLLISNVVCFDHDGLISYVAPLIITKLKAAVDGEEWRALAQFRPLRPVLTCRIGCYSFRSFFPSSRVHGSTTRSRVRFANPAAELLIERWQCSIRFNASFQLG
jgi:hypothetical protein